MNAACKRQAIQGPALPFSGKAGAAQATGEAELTRLHAKIGRLLVERDRTASQQQNHYPFEPAVGAKYRQPGELATGSAIELPGTVITPFAAHRGGTERNAFEDALFLWEAAQQHVCTTYQALLQTPFTVPAVGRVKLALAALER
jgi:hypothetical protein